ncbi:MAG: hypothetical protein U9R66_14305 [Thermodesulfobacteriota bacterium]|nr:hypothetical protein [Thermodesulfobacteriota bacterium]
MKKVVLFAVVGLLLFGQVSVFAEDFNTSDMEGTWYLFDTTVNPATLDVYWTYGEMEADASGKILSGSYQDPLGNTFAVTDGNIMLDNKGVMSGTASVDMGPGVTATAIFPHGKIDQAKTNGAYVTLMTVDGSSDPPSMGAGFSIKGGGTFAKTDLEGDWHAYSAIIDVVAGQVFWVYGTFSVDAAGTVTADPDSYYTPFATATVTGGTLTLDTDGKISGIINITYENPPGTEVNSSSVLAAGKMDQSKTTGTYVAHNLNADSLPDLLSLETTNLVKAGGAFTSDDNVGDWYTYGLAIDPVTPAVFWSRGQFHIDSSGNTTGSWFFPDGTVIKNTGGTMSTDSKGVFTGDFTLDTGDTLTIRNGKSAEGKTQGALVSTTTSGMMFVGVNIKDTYTFPWSSFLPAIMNHE